MPQGTIVWLAVLAALGVLFLLTLRRMSVLVGRTRDLERYQRGTRGIDRRLTAVVEPFVARLDELRRRAGDPHALADALPATQDELRALAAEARALRAPAALERPATAFVVELERAVRATELVEHGLDALLADRGGRDLEGQTSLKRAALNLRHAREAVARHAADVAALRPADLLARPRGREGAVRPVAPTYLVDAEFDPDRS